MLNDYFYTVAEKLFGPADEIQPSHAYSRENESAKVNRTALIHLTERWRKAVERKLFVGILLVDFIKPFDTVLHNILLQKLNDLGIRGDIWLWLKNFLRVRRQFVRINGCDSDTHIITRGVPQGSVLGPTLLSLFTNDLPKSLRSAETYLYADETTI